MVVVFAEKELFYLKIVVCILCLATFLLVLIYMKVLFAKTFCHPNLRFLILVQPFIQWLVLLNKALYHIVEFFQIHYDIGYQTIFHDFALMTAVTLMLPISIERLYATLHPEKYERMHQNFPVMGVWLLVILSLHCATMCILWHLRLVEPVAMFAVVFIMFTVATVFFALLPLTSRRLFQEAANLKESTIGKRYQTAENMRSAHLLKYISAYKTVTNYISLGLFFYTFNQPTYYYYFATEMYYFWVTAQLTCQILLTIFAHDTLKHEFQRIFGLKRNVPGPKEHSPLSITGQQMMFSTVEERENHFGQLARAWEGPA